MRRSKQVICKMIIASMISVSAFGVAAMSMKSGDIFNPIKVEAANSEEENTQPFYQSFTGTVKEIKPVTDTNGNSIPNKYSYLTENEDGIEVNFIVTDNTYFFNATSVKVGDIVTGFYESNKSVIMIYPTPYEANILAVNVKDKQLKADVFDSTLLSGDKTLKINVTNDIKVYNQSGTLYKGSIASKKLLVVYSSSTRSIPAQTTPEQIIVLEDKKENQSKVSKMEIVVNNMVLKGSSAYETSNNTVMVPIRSISEALGYKVKWYKSTKTVTLNNKVSLVVGKDSYTLSKSIFSLDIAPQMIHKKVYVPLNFFKEVLGIDTAKIIDGQIVIYNK